MSISLKHLYTTGQTITESELALLQRLQKQAKPMSFFVLLEDNALKTTLTMPISLTILAAQSRGLVRRRYGNYMVLTQRGLLALNLHAVKTTKHAVIKQAIVQQELFPESLVIREGNRIYTTSLKVAEHFGKRHDTVLRAISQRFTQVDVRKIADISKVGDISPLNFEDANQSRDGLKIEPISEPDLVKAKAIADFLKLHVELSHYIDKYGRQNKGNRALPLVSKLANHLLPLPTTAA